MRKLWRGVASALVASALAMFVAAGAQAQGAAAPAKDLVLRGDAKCTKCHDQDDNPALLDISRTKHGVKADARTPTCTSCHGESESHINKPAGAAERPKPDRTFKRNDTHTTPAAQSEACTSCHKGGHLIQWAGSAHERTQTSCSSCHSVHVAKDQVLVRATQAGVCYTCHKDVRAQTFAVSAHPIRQGVMSCSSCHAPHGSLSERFSLVKSSVNDTCYTCHAGKRGPFLWPHPPVVEDCGNCHNPHGTNIAPMLNARSPYLCQQCHIIGQHPNVLRSGNALPSNTVGNLGNANTAYLVGQACANCHTKVHGSNHPSGNAFTR
ncbi:MAG: DmsE family decaheme c-type cytochrome [Burkholderiales bacterium]|nr:DmsE family decaheme c-type cytochrome [Burkholderiales bacterium]